MGYQRRSTWDSCSRVQPTMKLLVLSALAAMAMAEPEAKPGYFGLGYGLGYGLGGYYGGYRGHYIGKREADAEPGYLGLGYGYGLGGSMVATEATTLARGRLRLSLDTLALAMAMVLEATMVVTEATTLARGRLR